MSTRFFPTRLVATPGLALLLLGACDDPADLAREVTDAQGECDQDSLRVGSEECVQMFKRYAEMATEAMHTYIGGMKALDEALQRMPPANFDTASFGRALTPPAAGPRTAQNVRSGTDAPGTPSFDRAREREGYRSGSDGGAVGYPSGAAGRTWRDPRADERELRGGNAPGRYPDPRMPQQPDPRGWGGDPRGWSAPRGQGADPRGWGDAYPPPPGPGAEYPRDDRGWSGSGREVRPEPREEEWEEELPRPSGPPPRSAPGKLLPPEERLNRPWIGGEGRTGRAGERYRAGAGGAYLPPEEDAENAPAEGPPGR